MNHCAHHRRHCVFAGLLVLAAAFLLPGRSSADDALVLPKGRFRLTLDNYFYLPITERWNANGNAEDLATDFEGRRLDSSVFSLLRPLDPFVSGGASIGDSRVSFTYDYNILDLGAQYGLTDRLSIGVRIPYYWATNDVEARVDAGPGSSASVGLRTGPGPAGCTAAVVPLACPNARRFTTEDVQQLLGAGLPGVPGFGFKRVETWSGDALGDIEAGLKYQYLRTEDWRLATTLGVRFPTGRQDDPDDLADIPFGLGAYTLLLRLHNDFLLSNLWKAPNARGTPELPKGGDVLLDGTVRWDHFFPERATRRISSDETNPITTNRERVLIDLGERFEIEASGRYNFTSALSLLLTYRYSFRTEDDVSGRRGFAYKVLEKDTDATEQAYIVGVSYSTLPMYMERRFPVPLVLSVSFRDRFAGSGPRASPSSQVLRSRYFDLGLAVLF